MICLGGSCGSGSSGNSRTQQRRSSFVVIPPMQICPGDLLVYSKVLTQRNSVLGNRSLIITPPPPTNLLPHHIISSSSSSSSLESHQIETIKSNYYHRQLYVICSTVPPFQQSSYISYKQYKGNKYQFNLFVFLLFFLMFSDWEGSTQSLAGDTGNYIINMSSLSTILGLVQLVRSFTVVYYVVYKKARQFHKWPIYLLYGLLYDQ